MQTFETLSEAISALKKEGYTIDFNLKENCIECSNKKYKLFHGDFVIDKFFRFDNDEDPSDQAILYAISAPEHGIKGLLVNGYGRYGDSTANELIAKLKVKD